MKKCAIIIAILVGTMSAACSPESPATRPAPALTVTDSPDFWRALTAPLSGEKIFSPSSFAVIAPRDDIDLESEMGRIPVTAGIASHFYFFRCTCGKVKTLGDVLACDYETNDVLDTLRSGNFTIVSMSSVLENTRPRLVSIHFQAEGDGYDLVKTLRDTQKVLARRRDQSNGQ